MHSAKHWFSILFGLFLMIVGILPVLSTLGILGFDFSSVIGQAAFLFAFVVAFAGLYLIVDSFHEIGSLAPVIGWVTLGVGFLVLGFGVIQVLIDPIGLIAWEWWPEVPEIFYYSLFILEGVLLFIAGFLD